MSLKGDIYLLYIGTLSIIGGVYTIINHKSTEDPTLNLQMGLIFSIIGLLFVYLFIRQIKRNQKK